MIRSVFNNAIWYLAAIGLLVFVWLMAQLIFPYTSGDLEIDFLLTKQFYIHLWHYRWSFYLHIFSSLFILMAGLTQFSSGLLKSAAWVHRWVGKMYVFFVLVISGPAAMVMALYANGGVFAKVSFLLLGSLWWWFTFKGFRLILKGKVEEHRAFMIRSYALSLSAITLRVIQYMVAYFTDWDYEVFYTYNAWISWIINMVLAEIYIGRAIRSNVK